jgi:hypothetical protein
MTRRKKIKRAGAFIDKRRGDPILEMSVISQIGDYMRSGDSSTEVCGYFEMVPDTSTLRIRRPYYEGRMTIDGRHMCERKGSPTGYRWHTHPIDAKFYPSEEDIYSVLKGNYYSYIFTPIGFWTLHSAGNPLQRFTASNKKTTKGRTKKRVKKRGRQIKHSKSRMKSRRKSRVKRASSHKGSSEPAVGFIRRINKTMMHQALDYRRVSDKIERLEIAIRKYPQIKKYENALMKEFPGFYIEWSQLEIVELTS